MLGHYGLQNEMVAWLLRRRPDLLAETPTEFRRPPEAAPRCPACRLLSTLPPPAMLFRYDDRGRAVWKCYEHDPPVVRLVQRATPAMQRDLGLDLGWMLKATLEGKILDLVFDDGGWLPQARTPEGE